MAACYVVQKPEYALQQYKFVPIWLYSKNHQHGVPIFSQRWAVKDNA